MSKGRIFFSENIAEDLRRYCEEKKKAHLIFICDTNTKEFCLPFFSVPAQVIVIPSGEQSKNLDTYTFIMDELVRCNTGRSSLIVNLGGGVVTDIGGFAASTFMRGIDFINIPTTLVGMVDAAIGGKTGIDFKYYKNYIGTFSLPEQILVFPEFLKTLPPDEKLSGKAEIIKTGIVSNASLFQKACLWENEEELIRMTAETKGNIVENDFLDKGERQILNFGHTIGHAYESYSLKTGKPVLHGFAVAIGMMAESRIAFDLAMIKEQELKQILACINHHFRLPELLPAELDSIKEFLVMDKKNAGNEIMFSLPAGIGSCKTRISVSFDRIKSILLHVEN